MCSLLDTHVEAIGRALDETGTRSPYTSHIPLENFPANAGGIIPTDTQGLYWYDLPGFFAGCTSPYYHTAGDTPDKLDVARLVSRHGSLEMLF